MPKQNLPRGGLWNAPRSAPNTGARFNAYAGSNADRQSRFESRSARRWGDWGILNVPTAMLWFDELELAAAADDDESNGLAPAIIDIWE